MKRLVVSHMLAFAAGFATVLGLEYLILDRMELFR